jgi:replication factor C subunit 3/5
MFLIDKYRIKNTDDVVFHKDIYKRLSHLADKNDLPHLLFYGRPGSGKDSIVHTFLENIYDKSIYTLKKIKYSVKGYGNTSVDVIVEKSKYHLVINPTSKGLDKYIIQEIVKDYAQKPTVRLFNSKIKYKVILIHDVEKLSYYAQASLRRTMEKYVKTCKFFLVSSQISKIMKPLCSRCLLVRIPAPTYNEIFETLFKITIQEDIRNGLDDGGADQLTPEDFDEIIVKSNRNIRSAIWLLELHTRDINFDINWRKAITKIVNHIISCYKKNITAQVIMNMRKLLYEIFVTNVNIMDLIKEFTRQLLVKIDDITTDKNDGDIMKCRIINIVSKYEARVSNGKRQIIHLEAMILNTIKLIQPTKPVKQV